MLPKCENALGYDPESYSPQASHPARRPGRTLLGISLSGLFAVWAWMQGDDFDNIASISGSFWYDGFTDWLARNAIRKDGQRAFLCLGDKEGYTHVRRYKSIPVDTSRVADILSRCGARVTDISVPGTHYADPLPRIRIALAALR